MTENPSKLGTESTKVDYVYPDLGNVQIQLFKESKKIYEFLNNTKSIDHFEKIDQLGALRTVHKSAHHSRWEYMILQMHILEQLRENSSISLKTGVDLPKKKPVSSIEELIKSWIFLNNYGHLKDTFEAERVWFELIIDIPEMRKALYDAMPDPLCRKFVDAVLSHQDLFSLHHLFAIVLLTCHKDKINKMGGSFELWLEMIKALLRELTDVERPKEGSKLSRALNIFHAIRRVSYVLLDINASPLFLRIDSHNLLRNVLAQPESLIYDDESNVNMTLDQMERLLFSEMYASKEVCDFKYHYFKGQKKRFERNVKKNTLQVYCRDSNEFASQLRNAMEHNFGDSAAESRIRRLCRLTLLPHFPFERTECHYYDEQKNLCSQVNKKIQFVITPYPYPGNGNIVDSYSIKKMQAKDWCQVYDVLARYLTECHAFEVEEPVLTYGIAQSLQELFQSIFERVIDPALILRFSPGTSPLDYTVGIVTDSNWRSWLKNMRENIVENGLTDSRKAELTALLSLLSRKRGRISLVAQSNVRLYNSDGISKVEWDGIFINIQKDDVTLHFLEAKRGVTRKSTRAKKALDESMIKAGLRYTLAKPPIVRCDNYAYCVVSLLDIEVY